MGPSPYPPSIQLISFSTPLHPRTEQLPPPRFQVPRSTSHGGVSAMRSAESQTTNSSAAHPGTLRAARLQAIPAWPRHTAIQVLLRAIPITTGYVQLTTLETSRQGRPQPGSACRIRSADRQHFDQRRLGLYQISKRDTDPQRYRCKRRVADVYQQYLHLHGLDTVCAEQSLDSCNR